MSSKAALAIAPEACDRRAGALTLARFLPYRLNVAAALVSEGLARIYGERFGIGVPEWRVLATIGEFEAVTASFIAAHAHLGKVKVSRAVAALEGRRLIARRSDEQDGRQAVLRLTATGQALYREIAGIALGYVEDLTAGLSAREEAALDAVLDKLVRRAGAMAARSEAPR